MEEGCALKDGWFVDEKVLEEGCACGAGAGDVEGGGGGEHGDGMVFFSPRNG